MHSPLGTDADCDGPDDDRGRHQEHRGGGQFRATEGRRLEHPGRPEPGDPDAGEHEPERGPADQRGEQLEYGLRPETGRRDAPHGEEPEFSPPAVVPEHRRSHHQPRSGERREGRDGSHSAADGQLDGRGPRDEMRE